MEKHTALSDQEFERQVRVCAFNPVDFTHEAHLRLAWILIESHGIEDAEKQIQELLLRFVEFAGARDKYNTTLTIAAMRAVDHFKRKSNSESFLEFIVEFPRLKYNFKELMAAHYGFDVFSSHEARLTYIEPDLLPFDE